MNRNDEELVIAFREGDGDALTELVKRLGPGLLGYLRKMLGSSAESEKKYTYVVRKYQGKRQNRR